MIESPLSLASGTWEGERHTLARAYLAFRLRGGVHPFRAALHLWCEGRIVATATGDANEAAPWRCWDVRAWRGREIHLQAVKLSGTAGDALGVLAVEPVDEPRGTVEPDVGAAVVAVQREAEAAVRAAARQAEMDPQRPCWHFLPPAQRMNDPNGPFFADGWYHLFYQWNVFSDRMGEGLMTWGHARSRDLVRWEHLPVGLWPDWTRGEVQCFSGGAARTKTGEWRLFYTGLPAAGAPRWQSMATPADSEFRHWQRHPANPVLDPATQDGPPVHPRWRDPFVFTTEGRTFMLLAAGHVPIYEARDDSLTRWTYRGVFFDREGLDVECPNFFPFGSGWLCLMSPCGPVEWQTGRFEAGSARFGPDQHGYLSHSAQYYATHGMFDPAGRLIVFGVIKGCPDGRGWRDCLAVPRVVTPGPDGRPRQTPIEALAALRGERRLVADRELCNRREVIAGVSGESLELAVEIDANDGAACGLLVRCAVDGTDGVEIRRVGNELRFAGMTIPLQETAGPWRLRVWLDHGAIEVFTDEGRVAEVAIVTPHPANIAVAWWAEGGSARLVRLEAWPLRGLDFGLMPWAGAESASS